MSLLVATTGNDVNNSEMQNTDRFGSLRNVPCPSEVTAHGPFSSDFLSQPHFDVWASGLGFVSQVTWQTHDHTKRLNKDT